MNNTYVLKQCRLISQLSQDGAPEFADVVIRDGIIAEINESGRNTYEGIEVIDLK